VQSPPFDAKCRRHRKARRFAARARLRQFGGVAGFASIGGGTRVLCASRTPGISQHVAAAIQRSVPAAWRVSPAIGGCTLPARSNNNVRSILMLEEPWQAT